MTSTDADLAATISSKLTNPARHPKEPCPATMPSVTVRTVASVRELALTPAVEQRPTARETPAGLRTEAGKNLRR